MRAFWGVARYEYRMMIRRWGLWLALALAAGPVLVSLITGGLRPGDLNELSVWQIAGFFALRVNLFMPVVGGIAVADRLQRDSSLGVQELLKAAPLPRAAYVLGKYAGTVLGVLTPTFVFSSIITVALLFQGVSVGVLFPSLLAFLAINAPAYAFVGAFSLACTAVLPVRIYQVLFTGYWFWGNFLSPNFLPTISGTPLNASGTYASQGFFGAGLTAAGPTQGAPEAALNLGVLALCAAIALFALERYLTWQDRRA